MQEYSSAARALLADIFSRAQKNSQRGFVTATPAALDLVSRVRWHAGSSNRRCE